MISLTDENPAYVNTENDIVNLKISLLFLVSPSCAEDVRPGVSGLTLTRSGRPQGPEVPCATLAIHGLEIKGPCWDSITDTTKNRSRASKLRYVLLLGWYKIIMPYAMDIGMGYCYMKSKSSEKFLDISNKLGGMDVNIHQYTSKISLYIILLAKQTNSLVICQPSSINVLWTNKSKEYLVFMEHMPSLFIGHIPNAMCSIKDSVVFS